MRQGQTIYRVKACGADTQITKVFVQGKPQPTKFAGFPTVNGDIFLNDYNCSYNNHKLFRSRRKAESYKKLCIQCDIPPCVPNKDYLDCHDFGSRNYYQRRGTDS